MRFVRPIAAAIGLVVVGLLLWANQWKYFPLSGRLVRVNRFSGNAFLLTGDGWEPMQKEEMSGVEPMRPAPALTDTGMVMDTAPPRTAPKAH